MCYTENQNPYSILTSFIQRLHIDISNFVFQCEVFLGQTEIFWSKSQFAGWLFYTLDCIPEDRIMCLVWIVIQNFLLQRYSTLRMWRIVCMTVEPRLLLKIVWYEHMIYNRKSIHMQILWYMMWTNAIRCFCESLLLWLSFTDCT